MQGAVRTLALPVHRVRPERTTSSVQLSRIMASVGEITPYCVFGETHMVHDLQAHR